MFLVASDWTTPVSETERSLWEAQMALVFAGSLVFFALVNGLFELCGFVVGAARIAYKNEQPLRLNYRWFVGITVAIFFVPMLVATRLVLPPYLAAWYQAKESISERSMAWTVYWGHFTETPPGTMVMLIGMLPVTSFTTNFFNLVIALGLALGPSLWLIRISTRDSRLINLFGMLPLLGAPLLASVSIFLLLSPAYWDFGMTLHATMFLVVLVGFFPVLIGYGAGVNVFVPSTVDEMPYSTTQSEETDSGVSDTASA